MTIRAALATITACTALLAVIGGGIGWGIGTFAPGYYRTVFRSGNEAWFDPISVGIGQGLGQGTAGGVVVGLAVVALFLWRDSRVRKLSDISIGEHSYSATDW
jgi:hypothetical protein